MRKLIAMLLVSVCLTAAAKGDQYRSVTDYILGHSPELGISRLGNEAAAESAAAENMPDGPEVNFDQLWPTMQGEDIRRGVEVSQSFAWPGAYRAQGKAAKADAAARSMAMTATERAIYRKASSLLLQLAHGRQSEALFRAIATNLDSVQSLIDAGLQVGRYTVLDLRKVELERIEALSGLDEAEAFVTSVCAELEAMAPGAARLADGLTDFPPVELLSANYYRQLLEQSPEAGALGAQIAAAEAQSAAARQSKLPGFSLGYLYEYEDGTHFNGFSVGIGLPGYGSGKKAHAAKLEAETAALQVEARQNERQALLDSEYQQAVRLSRLVGQMKELTEQSDYLQLLNQLLEGRGITTIDYFNEINYYITVQINCLKRELELQELMLRLNFPL